MELSTVIKTNEKNSLSKIELVESVARYQKQLRKIELTINLILISIEILMYVMSFIVLYNWKVMSNFYVKNTNFWEIGPFWDYIFLLSIIFFIYISFLISKRLFSFYNELNFLDIIFSIIKATFFAFMIAIGILFLLKTSIIYSRLLISLFSLSMVFVAISIRGVKLLIISELSKRGILTKNILIVGAGNVGVQIKNYILKHPNFGFKFIGFLDDTKKSDEIIGKLNDLEKVIEQYKVSDIYITIPSEKKIISKFLTSVRKYDVGLKIIPELYDFIFPAIQFKKTDVYPYLQVIKTPLKGFNLLIKRIFDFSLSLLGILFLLPIFLLTAISIKLDSHGPIFFKQKRIGKNGVPFNMYKFRSMVVNAEELKEKLSKQNEADGLIFKIKEDPRVTKVGRIIRKYSIDELPQLFNVLKGNMSLIGPRPPLVKEVTQYNDYHWRRMDINPGISGLWQVSGRSDLSFDEMVNLDIYYIENWSLTLDLKILLRTIPAVIKGEGAY